MNTTLLRKNMVQVYNKSELRTLCHDLSINYENLPGKTLEDKIRELIEYCSRYGQLHELLIYCQKSRPKIAWQNLFPGHVIDEQLKTGNLSQVDWGLVNELMTNIEKEDLNPLGQFAKLTLELVRRGIPIQTWSYPEFWEWLEEAEKQMGRGVVYIKENEIGYIPADHVLAYSSKDMAYEILNYKLGREYIMFVELDVVRDMSHIAYRKETRLPQE